MVGKYAYSLNGEHYRGAYPTREEALQDAIAAARRSPSGAPSVYVGHMVPADPKACGHARAILSNMGARAREQFGDSASGYLTRLRNDQIEDLDSALELVVLGWLVRHDLMPTFFKIDAVSEYPVPTPRQSTGVDGSTEVQEIGSGEYGI